MKGGESEFIHPISEITDEDETGESERAFFIRSEKSGKLAKKRMRGSAFLFAVKSLRSLKLRFLVTTHYSILFLIRVC